MAILLNLMFLYVVLIVIAICVPIAIIASIVDSRNKKKLLDWGVERACSIALHQNWVSPHRMMTQCHLTKSNALEVLFEACKRGLLYQEINGRYYIMSVEPDHGELLLHNKVQRSMKNDNQRRFIEANRWRDNLD